MSTLLAIDTATPNLVVGLLHKEQNYVADAIQTIKHTDVILPAIDSVLKQASCSKKMIEAIVVGIGPGSFMGVRTAIATAQGLALALECPVIPISSLEIIAKTANFKYGWQKIAVAWDARMDSVYFGQYDFAESVEVYSDQLLAPAEIQLNDSGWAAVGNGWQQYQEQFLFDLHEQFVELDLALTPDAKALLALGLRNWVANQAISAEQLEANYIRLKVTS